MDLDELVPGIRSFSDLPLADKQAFIEKLVAIHPTLNLNWGSGHSFRRARRLQSGELPKTVDDVIWRKGVTAKLGRANPEGVEVLYLADRPDTALREARIDRDWVAIADFEISAGQSIFTCPIGEFYQISRTGRGFLSGDNSGVVSQMLNACPLKEARSLLLTDAFLYEQIVGHDDYELSSTVAQAIFKKRSHVSAIAYSSRRQIGAINVAVRTGGFWNAWAVTSVRCAMAEHLALGYYKLSEVKNVVAIFESGKFQWADAVSAEEARIILKPPYFPKQL